MSRTIPSVTAGVVLLLAAAVAFLPAVSSCTMSNTIVVKSDGSGTVAVRLEVTKLFREYLASMAEVAGQADPAKKGELFDLKEIRKGFEDRPGVTVRRLASPKPEVLEADLAFRSVQEVFASEAALKSTGVVTFTQANGTRTLKLHLDRSNYGQVAKIFPGLSNPLFEGMGPQESDTITEEEYLEMIRFSLGDEGPGLVKKSFIDVTIRPEGEIVSQAGGTAVNGGVLFRIPLLRLLVLDKPLDYAVTFR
jgi:hypothetical protein